MATSCPMPPTGLPPRSNHATTAIPVAMDATPIVGAGRPDRAAVTAMTASLSARLQAMLRDAAEPERKGRLGRWMTERFNEWPEGSRDAALAAQLAGETVEVARAG